MEKGWILLISVLIVLSFVSAAEFTPQGNINLRNLYNITNVPSYNGTDINISGNITAGFFVGDGSQLTGISVGTPNIFDQVLNTTSNVTFFNVTAQNFNGGSIFATFYNWVVGLLPSSNYLSFNGTHLEFNETYLNTTIGIFNDSGAAYTDAQDTAVNTTIANYVDTNFLLNFGDTATGNYTFDTTTLFIDSSSNIIGIGTSTPDGLLNVFSGSAGTVTARAAGDDLVVEHSFNGGISILVPNTSTSTIIFGSPADSLGADLKWNYDNNKFIIGTRKVTAELQFVSGGGIDAMIIDGDQNIGIGTLTPQNLFNVLGDANVTGNVYRNNQLLIDWIQATNGTLADNTTIAVYIVNVNTTMANYVNAVNASQNTSIINFMTIRDLATNLTIADYADAQDVVANTSATDWVDLLFVRFTEIVDQVGNWTLDRTDYWNVSTSLIFTTNITTTGNLTADFFFGNGSQLTSLTESQIVDLVHTTDTNETTRFNNLVTTDCSAGNLVIGVQDNGTVLCAVDSTTNSSYLLNTGDTATGNYTFDSGTFFINADDNRIGIGTSSPSVALEVIGSGIIGLVDFISDTVFASSIRTTSVDDSISTGNSGINFGGNSKFINFETDATERMRIISDGKIGIGTSTPQNTLNVDGDLNVTGNSILNLNWTFLQNYPSACPSGTFVTQVDDSITCTAPVADDVDPGSFPAGNYTFNGNVTADFYFGDGSQLTGIAAGGAGIWTNVSGTATYATDGGNVNLTGNLNVGDSSTDQILTFDDANPGNPSYSFSGDPNTGMFRGTSDQLLFGTGGSQRMEITSSGLIRIIADGSELSPSFSIGADTNTGLFQPATDSLGLTAGGVEFITLIETTQDNLVFNQDGDDMDFRFETDDNDDTLFIWGDNNSVGINTQTPFYPLEINDDFNEISLFVSKNISATGYITRTSVFDNSKNVWDYIKDASYYLTAGKIDHSKFYGYAGEFSVTDYSKPQTEFYVEEILNEITQKPKNVTLSRTIYPFIKTEGGVSLNAEVDLLRQAVFELKQDNTLMRVSLCNLGEIIWC